MNTIENLITDAGGNHLVVVLYFYDYSDKTDTFRIPDEFSDIDIADINIRKLDLNRPINPSTLFKLSSWLLEQFMLYPNSVFSFICSTDPLETGHHRITPELYRWKIFEALADRNDIQLQKHNISTQNIIVGPEGYQTFAKVFYRSKHAPIIHLVANHLASKYRD